MGSDPAVVWHDVECGSYRADLPLWRMLAGQQGDPILDVGAGTGRVTLELARAGWAVTALDSDARLLAELERRAAGLPVTTAVADARRFELDRRFALIVVPRARQYQIAICQSVTGSSMSGSSRSLSVCKGAPIIPLRGLSRFARSTVDLPCFECS